MWNRRLQSISAILVSAFAIAVPANPELSPGVWKDITPTALFNGSEFGSAYVEIDPSNPSTLYLAVNERGVMKTTDGGSNWAVLGTKGNTGFPTTHYLDNPIAIHVDPKDPLHLVASEGLGSQNGFWVSRDGGASWTMPQGFITAAATCTRDITQMAIDPTDFDHILVGSHSGWTSHPGQAGLLETKDGGATFIIHAPVSSWGTGSPGVAFLYNPDLKIGNSSTWLFSTDGDGDWRTTDGGIAWTRVNTWGCPHGGASTYYSKTGVLYAGGYQYPKRSADNGATWQQVVAGVSYAYYYTVQGDGDNLYTLQSFASSAPLYNAPYITSKESDGLSWTPYQNGAQKFGLGPFTMKFDEVNRIMYSATWGQGIWALRVIDPVIGTARRGSPAIQGRPGKTRIFGNARTGISIRSASGKLFDANGHVLIGKR